MVSLPKLHQTYSFENTIQFELDRAIQTAASAAVAASKTVPMTNGICNPIGLQLPFPNMSPKQMVKSEAANPIFQLPQIRNTNVCCEKYAPPSSSHDVSGTAAIISAMLNSTRPAAVKLDAYGPLLTVAIRQAISDCLSTSTCNFKIQGNLVISSESHFESESQASVNVYFNDTKPSIVDNIYPIVSSLNSLPTSLCENFSSVTHSPTSSKRKSYHPTKCFQSMSVINMEPKSPNCTYSLQNNNNQLSRSVSPSTTDSGALDLSRAGSLSGSTPITPMKALSIGSNDLVINSQYNMFPQASMLELYQRQLFSKNIFEQCLALSNPQAVDQLNKIPVKVSRKRIGLTHRLNTSIGGLNRRTSVTRKFPCNQCKIEFSSLHSLEDHTISEHGTYRCHICQAQFTQRSNLQRHALKHVGFKPFECRVCKKAYYRKDHLMRHMEMGHPGFSPRDNITVHLTSSESLDFLNSVKLNVIDQKRDENNKRVNEFINQNQTTQNSSENSHLGIMGLNSEINSTDSMESAPISIYTEPTEVC